MLMKFIEAHRDFIPAQTDFVRRKFRDIPYASGGIHTPLSHAPDANRRTLDLYLPNEGNGPFPVIVDIYGGGWFFGNKSSHKLEPALNLLKRGFAVVSINYSLSSQERFPVPVYETKAAIRYVRANAARYQLDPDRIALLGESAGAHMATYCAVTAACRTMQGEGWPNPEVSDQVQAVIALYCPTNIALSGEMFAAQKSLTGFDSTVQEYGEADSPEGTYLGGTPKEKAELFATANPENYLNPACPPHLFLHGSQDQVVPIVGTMTYAAMMMHQIGEENVRFQVVEGGHHNIADFEQEWIYDLEAAFLREKLGLGKDGTEHEIR